MKKQIYIRRRIRLVCCILLLGVIIVVTFFLAQSAPRAGGSAAAKELSISELQKNPYFREENRARYAGFADSRPELSADDVVWRVNAGLDKPFYSNVTEVTDDGTSPLLVNKYHKLPDGYQPAQLVKLKSGRLATPETKTAFEKLCAEAKKAGYTIGDVSTYRSISYQDGLYRQYLQKDNNEVVDTYSARPGYSEHHTGRALDICGANGDMDRFEGTPEAEWIAKNAYRFGFIVRYPKDAMDITGYKYEPWHITYVGNNVSQTMHDNGIETLEEYFVKYVEK